MSDLPSEATPEFILEKSSDVLDNIIGQQRGRPLDIRRLAEVLHGATKNSPKGDHSQAFILAAAVIRLAEQAGPLPRDK